MTATTNLDLRFIYDITFVHEDTRMFKARVVYLVPPDGAEDSGVRNPTTGRSEVAPYANLAISAFHSADVGWYGFHALYSEPYAVDLAQAELMVKLLRKIDKTLKRFTQQLGAVTDLAGFCGRVAQAIGCKSEQPFGEYCSERWMNGTHYRWRGVDSLRAVLASFDTQPTTT